MFGYERHGGDDCMMYGMGGMWFLWILIVVIIIGGAVMLFKSGSKSPGNLSGDIKGEQSARTKPLDIAKERYARGEITEEEFNRIVHKLKEHD